jgi:internalin A
VSGTVVRLTVLVAALSFMALTPSHADPGGQSAEEGGASKALEAFGAQLKRNSLKRVTSLAFLQHTAVEADLRFLRSLPELKEVIVSAMSLTRVGIDHLSAAKKLEVLQLTGSALNRESLSLLDQFDSVQTLKLNGPDLTDELLDEAKFPKGLQTLMMLFASNVTDRGLACLAKIGSLQRLDIGSPRITDNGLKALDQLRTLRQVFTHDSPVTGAFIARLSAQNELVSVGGRGFTNEGAAALAGCKQLRKLYLESSKITDAGMKHFSDLEKLEFLDLRNTKVKGSGLVYLGRLEKLSHLALSRTEVSDDSLLQLSNCRSLTRLFVDGSKVTSVGARRLKAVLPEIDVSPPSLLDATAASKKD